MDHLEDMEKVETPSSLKIGVSLLLILWRKSDVMLKIGLPSSCWRRKNF